MSSPDIRKNEVSFCADVKSWLERLFEQHPEWPFGEVKIEEYGVGNNKRQDIRILDRQHRSPVLTGEAKMPGTPEGRTPYDPALMQDAFLKADNIQSPYFFTWNVNTLVLFDRSRWDVPMIQRRVKEWDLGLFLADSGGCNLPEVQAKIRDQFLPEFFNEFARIVSGVAGEWGMEPDEVFIRSLESHLVWPVDGTRQYLEENCQRDKTFAGRFYEWLIQELQCNIPDNNPVVWRQVLDRASRTLCYVFCNRAIFYEAIRARYPEALPPLAMPVETTNCQEVYEHFRKQFEEAVRVTGDYEPVFYPQVNDLMGALVFASPQARQGWKGLLVNLDQYHFREVPHDIVGRIFQKLIAPEERQKFGQFFTHEDIVDVINAFCIRRAGDVVLDPSCGSGSFLVRAYHRKAWLSEQKNVHQRHQDTHKSHQGLLREIYGCDIALFPAHLATLNLAARQILDEENYPLIRRGNFFEVIEKPQEFCSIPTTGGKPGVPKQAAPIPLEPLDAVIGNPPYVRQELIVRRKSVKRMNGEPGQSVDSRQKNTKEHFQMLVSRFWPGAKLAGRSDLHCYFWLAAAGFLKDGGYFGFLTSSSWLDVEYGFPLQGWILKNFKFLAIIESMDEPWFEDARIKTCITILQRCRNEQERNDHWVKFVRLQKPLADILGLRPHGNETARQQAAQKLRNLIESTNAIYQDEKLRIIPILQHDLWKEGVEAGMVLGKGSESKSGKVEEDEENNAPTEAMKKINGKGEYAAGKWGRFVRAPDFYFRLMRDYGHRFVKLGEIANIRRGITSGCDSFFMPRDVTDKVLRQVREGMLWNNIGLMTSCSMKEVQAGRIRIVQAGDNTLHPIEIEYLRPEVHSLMEVDRPVIRAKGLERVVLWVNKPLKQLRSTFVGKYIQWGSKQTFISKKSDLVPVPQRSTCAARPLWYDLTSTVSSVSFWPMTQKYRHIVAANPENLACNHRLFYVSPHKINKREAASLPAILNSTLVALIKHFYGRYAGSEGTLDTEVIDCLLMQVPDPCGVNVKIVNRLKKALLSMSRRPVTHLVEQSMLQCHNSEHLRLLLKKPMQLPEELTQPDRRELDDAVLEMIGIENAGKRARFLDELYLETTKYYRYLRTQDIQAMEDRAGGKERKLTGLDLAAGIWDCLDKSEQTPLTEVVLKSLNVPKQTVEIPEGKARALGADHMFSPTGVDFVQGQTVLHETYNNTEQALLVEKLANLNIHGLIDLPKDNDYCRRCRLDIEFRLSQARARFEALAASRTGTPAMQEATTNLLVQWFIHGRGDKLQI